MADGRVAGDGFHGMQGSPVGPARQRPLRSAMLIAERDLQVEDILAVTLETEMSGLDHAGMHGADGHLVDLFAFHAIEIGDAADGRFAAGAAPGVVPRPIRGMEPQRLEPRMPFRPHAVLLGDLPLEEMDLRAVRRERRKAIRFQPRLCRRGAPIASRGRSPRTDRQGRRRRPASPNRAATRCPRTGAASRTWRKSSSGKLRHVGQGNRLAGMQRHESVFAAHGFTFRKSTASRNSDSSGGGI